MSESCIILLNPLTPFTSEFAKIVVAGGIEAGEPSLPKSAVAARAASLLRLAPRSKQTHVAATRRLGSPTPTADDLSDIEEVELNDSLPKRHARQGTVSEVDEGFGG